jgi:flagellar protein FlaJ
VENVKVIEDQFPAFLRDLVESKRSGMTMEKSLEFCSKRDYGRLTKEVKMMYNQISWGSPFDDVLQKFASRLADSDLIRRSIRIIIEAYKGGGDVLQTMETIATDATMVKESEKERKARMTQHVFVMYLVYFMFLGIVLALVKILIPIINMPLGASPIAEFGGSPCVACVGPFCFVCTITEIICLTFGFGLGPECFYRAVFFSMAIIQGIFGGLVIGQISEDSVIAGFKHSLILTGSGFTIFILFLYIFG